MLDRQGVGGVYELGGDGSRWPSWPRSSPRPPVGRSPTPTCRSSSTRRFSSPRGCPSRWPRCSPTATVARPPASCSSTAATWRSSSSRADAAGRHRGGGGRAAPRLSRGGADGGPAVRPSGHPRRGGDRSAMTENPYAIPVEDLVGSARVPLAAQLEEQPERRCRRWRSGQRSRLGRRHGRRRRRPSTDAGTALRRESGPGAGGCADAEGYVSGGGSPSRTMSVSGRNAPVASPARTRRTGRCRRYGPAELRSAPGPPRVLARPCPGGSELALGGGSAWLCR